MKFRKLMAAVALAAATANASALTFVSFLIDGDTFVNPFSVTNLSTNGESIIGIHFDLRPAAAVFDTIGFNGNPNNSTGKAFMPRDASVVGLLSPSVVADGSSVLDMAFNDFDAGVPGGAAPESFFWDVDVDSADGLKDTILGRELVGATMWVDFDNGERLFGVLVRDCVAFDTQNRCVAFGRVDAALFAAVGRTTIPGPNPTPEPGSLALAGLAMLALGAARKARQRG